MVRRLVAFCLLLDMSLAFMPHGPRSCPVKAVPSGRGQIVLNAEKAVNKVGAVASLMAGVVLGGGLLQPVAGMAARDSEVAVETSVLVAARQQTRQQPGPSALLPPTETGQSADQARTALERRGDDSQAPPLPSSPEPFYGAKDGRPGMIAPPLSPPAELRREPQGPQKGESGMGTTVQKFGQS